MLHITSSGSLTPELGTRIMRTSTYLADAVPDALCVLAQIDMYKNHPSAIHKLHKTPARSLMLFLEVFRKVLHEYPIRPNLVVLAGASMGAYGVYPTQPRIYCTQLQAALKLPTPVLFRVSEGMGVAAPLAWPVRRRAPNFWRRRYHAPQR